MSMSINTTIPFKYDTYKYNVKITPKFGELKELIEWCEQNCEHDWRFMEDIDDQWNSYVFLFNEHRDYVAFSLFKK